MAGSLDSWLASRGFTDIFLDHRSIAGGVKWRDALRTSAGSARVILCLVTEHWLRSVECFNEFRAAWYMGKRVIPLLTLDANYQLNDDGKDRLSEILAEDQGIDISACVGSDLVFKEDRAPETATKVLDSLREAGALAKVGLDPEAFAIDKTAKPTPFPGLSAFGDDDFDAALFFGRSREIAHTLEELRKMRAERDLRPLVILGASGAGKSSLLKAGIIPRLRREAPAWLPLRAFRPGADPLLNFAEAISKTYADFGHQEAYGVIRDRLLLKWKNAERSQNKELTDRGFDTLEDALEAEGLQLRASANRQNATILVSVDQAEEITRADDSSGEALSDYLRVALAARKSNWQIAFTIRTDSFPELQKHRRFQDLQARGYDLRAIPVFRFDNVVEEPAKRYGVDVDVNLIDALMEDAPKEDALPLLAFATQRLWHQYATTNRLTKANYDAVGGLRGLIEDAAERALRGIEPSQDLPLPSSALSARIDQLGASTFVPPLAQLNEQGATIRRVSNWDGFSEEQQELLDRFDRWRLIVRKGAETGGGTVEVAHETLFREWGRLRDWLEPERMRLESLRGLKATARTWERHDKIPTYLDHRDVRLKDALELTRNPNYASRIDLIDGSYLEACQLAQNAERRAKFRGRVALSILATGLIGSALAWWQQDYLSARYHHFVNVAPFILSEDAEQKLKHSETFSECRRDDLCPEMVVIPPGNFLMGTDSEHAGGYSVPQHEVSIQKSFAVSKYEITFDQWDTCVSQKGCDEISDDGIGRGNQPALNVTWHDARRYVDWLSKITGKEYRLLSEAEWEYAARAGTNSAYHWGEQIGTNNANCRGCGSKWDDKKTAPVGSFAPNKFGLHDMHGNVLEWCADKWHMTYFDKLTFDGEAWVSGNSTLRVLRGGAWRNEPPLLNVVARVGYPTDVRSELVGLRVARSISQ